MTHPVSRRHFVALPAVTFGTAAFLGALPAFVGAQEPDAKGRQEEGWTSPVSADYPTQERDDVRAIVGASHARFDAVKEMVERRPELAKAAWDWGFGDWETALGAASHTGRRDIAELLMANGARPDLFTFAMLGDRASLQAMVEGRPGIQRTPGPHGITLLQHAKNRLERIEEEGEEKRRVEETVAYLESLGDADLGAQDDPITEEEKAFFVGEYIFGEVPHDRFHVEIHRMGFLTIRRGDYAARGLRRVEPHGFAPAGSPSVRIRFTVHEGAIESVTIHNPEPIVTARRVIA